MFFIMKNKIINLLIVIKMTSIDYSKYKKLPKLVAFDLDGTIWTPDMYMLSGGAPFKISKFLLNVLN